MIYLFLALFYLTTGIQFLLVQVEKEKHRDKVEPMLDAKVGLFMILMWPVAWWMLVDAGLHWPRDKS